MIAGRVTDATGRETPARRVHLSALSLLALVLGPLTLIGLSIIHLSQGESTIPLSQVVSSLVSPDGASADAVVRHIRLPRTAIGIVAGAALAMSGVLLQTVTRNPLISASTIGVTAGAYVALVITTIFVPGVLGLSPLLVATVGGIGAVALAYAVAGGTRASPLALALAGVTVSLVFAAITAALQLLYEEETAGLFFWGSGSLAQDGWGDTRYAAPRLAVAAIAALALSRPLDVLLLGDDVARALGQRVGLVRATGLLTSVILAAVAVAAVGPIGFVGLIVPHLVRLAGVTRHSLLLPLSAIWGSALLLAADVAARLITTSISSLPAGSVTALVGAPFFVWLARRSTSGMSGARASGTVRRSTGLTLPYPFVLTGSTLLLALVLVAGVMLGDLRIAPSEILTALTGDASPLVERVIIDLRLPRLLVAALSGAALASSGVLLQGVVRNPLAGPEIVGVSAGAGLGALIVLVLFPGVPFGFVPVAAFVGAVLAFGTVYLVSWRGGIEPARLALAGIAMSAFCSAGISVLVVEAQLRVAQALVWLAGSTYARGWDDLTRLLPWTIILLPLAAISGRQLDLLALGDDAARALGLRIERWRIGILGLAVFLAAAAVSTVGTIGFVGLVGPHAARMLVPGVGHRRLLPLAAILGALLVTAADTIGRVALAPREIPSGLVTALIGAPYFLWLLWRRS